MIIEAHGKGRKPMRTKLPQSYRAFITLVFWSFIKQVILRIVRELEAKNNFIHFVHYWQMPSIFENHRSLSIKNAESDILGLYYYAQFEWNPLNTIDIERKQCAYNRETDGRLENIILRHSLNYSSFFKPPPPPHTHTHTTAPAHKHTYQAINNDRPLDTGCVNMLRKVQLCTPHCPTEFFPFQQNYLD